MNRSKKASMQLSINAIVILVMAMAVLGIGLSLIRGVLAPAQDNLQEAIDKVDLSETATSTKTIANIPQTIRMKNNRDNQLVVSFYNVGDTPGCSSQARLNVACQNFNTGDAANPSITSNALPLAAEVGSATTLIANVQPSRAQGTIPCQVQVECPQVNNQGQPRLNDPWIEADSASAFIDFTS